MDVVGSLSCEIFFFFVACFQTWSSNNIGVTREVVRGIFKFDISVRAVRNHRFASTTTSIYIRNFEMASSKMEGSSIFGDGLTGDGQILISA